MNLQWLKYLRVTPSLGRNLQIKRWNRLEPSRAGVFMASREAKNSDPLCNCDNPKELSQCSKSEKCQYRVNQVAVFIKTYGCQMNENDTSIIKSILQDYGYKIIDDDTKAEIQLLMTCAIRESAESKIWTRLNQLKASKWDPDHPLEQVGLLGCMAERLKDKILDSSSGFVDIVAGPDSYRDLPRLLSINRMTTDKAVNCLLSFDETYSDIRPVTKIGDVTSFVSITRGCDNLCSYCVVPFTRGRERSRPIETILEEVRILLSRGIKEVTLLGQNVNSYRDVDTKPDKIGRIDLEESVSQKEEFAEGFKTVYKPRQKGITFDILLEEVAKISPNLRVRFTSPHPKDFTEDVIDVIARYPNITRSIHLPAQSGSDMILEKMRRGYTKKSYLDLVKRMHNKIDDLSLSSDFITGFCGETNEDHEETMDLIRRVRYRYIYAFPYSERSRTHAYHNLDDDVLKEVKIFRLNEIMELFRKQAEEMNSKLIGSHQLILVERTSKRSQDEWLGRTLSNIKTIIPNRSLSVKTSSDGEGLSRDITVGDHVLCQINQATSESLKASPIYITDQAFFDRLSQIK